jgi:hypothetical protein
MQGEMMMEAKPVQRIEQPAYPTRREMLAGAVSFALLSLTECNFAVAEDGEGKVTVAPIFKHGEGRGATGCVVLSPPIFLSEEEAMQIVKEELAKHGVTLASGPVLKDLIIAPRRMRQLDHDEKSKKIVPDKENAAPLHVTGMDEKKLIAIKFICETNYAKLGGVNPHRVDVVDRDGNLIGASMSTVRLYDFKDAAEYVAAEAKKQGKQQLFFGVFYDPFSREASPFSHEPPARTAKNGEKVDLKAERERREKQAKQESEKQLREQAQDFAAWLKKQKAIE